MRFDYKTIVTFIATLIAVTAGTITPYAAETLTEHHDADEMVSDLHNWYSTYFTGSSYIAKSEVPVLAFSACASNEDIALMLASAALSTHDNITKISSHELLSDDSSYRREIKSKTSGLELKYVVLRIDQVRSAPPQICVLITQE